MIRVPSIEEILTGSSRETEEWLDDELFPSGATRFRDFRDRLGKAVFPDNWTGEECAGWFAGSFGRVHRSEAERDADLEWYRAKSTKEHELAGLPVREPWEVAEHYGGGIDDTYEKGAPLDHVELTPEQLAEIDRKIEPLKTKALAVKHRREAVESKLQQIFWNGTLGAFYISRDDGRKVDIARSEWGVKRRRSGKFNSDKVYLHEIGVFPFDDSGERREFTILIDKEEAKAVLSTDRDGTEKNKAPPSTAGAETKCREWLIALMTGNSKPEKAKAAYKTEAQAKFSVGSKAFGRAWTRAIEETGNVAWSKPGRKS